MEVHVRTGWLVFMFSFGLVLGAQEQAAPTPTAPPEDNQPKGWRRVADTPGKVIVVPPGTRIPLNLINSISTKSAAEGERVYLETAFPIVIEGRMVIPPGSYVAGTITHIKKPGRVKGRGELFLRFDSLTLPNGVTRDFRGTVGTVDGTTQAELDRSEGKIRSEGNKSGDARTVGETAAAGASVGVIAGSAAGSPGMGAGIGAAAGATAGLLGVLLSRGPDAILGKGTTVEMVLDRPLTFDESELDFSNASTPRHRAAEAPSSQPVKRQRQPVPIPGRRIGRFPL